MKILVSNDDGVDAPGLAALARALSAKFSITVVAPDENRSGASNSLSLQKSLRVRENGNGFFRVDGTPADCVNLAVTGSLGFRPDLVVAGINHGANLGDDVLYSGTVAAAVEGRFLGLPALAVSLAVENNDESYFDTAAEVALQLLRGWPQLPRDTILNVNVPNVPARALRGMRATRLGARHPSLPALAFETAEGGRVYQIGAAGQGADAGPGTDFDALRENAVSVTPLQIDMTRHNSVENVANWLSAVSRGAQ